MEGKEHSVAEHQHRHGGCKHTEQQHNHNDGGDSDINSISVKESINLDNNSL